MAHPPSGQITPWEPVAGGSNSHSQTTSHVCPPSFPSFLVTSAGASLLPFVLPEPPACLSSLWTLHKGVLPPPPHPTQLHLAGWWGEGGSCPSILFTCTERGLNKCLVSDRRMTTKGTIRGKLGRKGPLRSPGLLSYPVPSALRWTSLGIGSLCHPRQLSPLPVGRKWLPWVNQRRDSGGGTSQVNFKAVVTSQWAVEKLDRVKMKWLHFCSRGSRYLLPVVPACETSSSSSRSAPP